MLLNYFFETWIFDKNCKIQISSFSALGFSTNDKFSKKQFCDSLRDTNTELSMIEAMDTVIAAFRIVGK